MRVTRGRILDVAVDLRRASPTFGRHVAVELSAENWRQLLVPVGFAHGFCTLEPDSEVLYKVTNVYSPAHDLGLAFDDPALGIAWGVDLAEAVLSDKDRKHPRLADLGPQSSTEAMRILVTGTQGQVVRALLRARAARASRSWRSGGPISISPIPRLCRAGVRRPRAPTSSSTPPPIPRSTRPRPSRSWRCAVNGDGAGRGRRGRRAASARR